MELHADIVKRQAQMQRKYDFLLRRLNKLQARYMGQHVSDEIAGLFKYSQRYWKKKDKEHTKGLNTGSTSASPTSLILDPIVGRKVETHFGQRDENVRQAVGGNRHNPVLDANQTDLRQSVLSRNGQ